MIVRFNQQLKIDVRKHFQNFTVLHEAVDSVSVSAAVKNRVCLFVTVECTFIVLCRKLYEESEHNEVGKL